MGRVPWWRRQIMPRGMKHMAMMGTRMAITGTMTPVIMTIPPA
jgi:hypothetical protein